MHSAFNTDDRVCWNEAASAIDAFTCDRRLCQRLFDAKMSAVRNSPAPHVTTTPNDTHQRPCGAFSEPVTWSQRGVVCEACDQWHQQVFRDLTGSYIRTLLVAT